MQQSNFATLVQGLASDAPKFKSIVEHSVHYSAIRKTISTRISNDFDELLMAVSKFEECRDVNEFYQNFVFEEFKEENKDIEPIKKYLALLATWENNVQQYIRPQDTRGLIQANGKKLKENLQRKVRDEQANMKKYLIDLSDELNLEITNGYRDIRKKLDRKFVLLNEYVEYWGELKKCISDKEKLVGKTKLLNDMLQLLKKYRSRDEGYGYLANPQLSDLAQKLEKLQKEGQEVDEIIQQKQGEVIQKKSSMLETLSQNIDGVKKKIEQNITAVNTELLLSAQTPFSEALEELDHLKQQFDKNT